MEKQELIKALEQNGNAIVNKNKIVIRHHTDDTITAIIKLRDDEEKVISLELEAEYANAEEFVLANSLNNITDI